jgi:AcrR family transcriptional regulator
MSSTSAGLRERKKERTRRHLAEMALDLFEAQGYDRTTVDDIAAAADVSPRTFFRYFSAKDEAVFDRADDVAAEFRALLASRPTDEPLMVSLDEIGKALIADEVVDQDRIRRVLTLVHHEPALRGRYDALMAVIEAEITTWAAERLGEAPTDLRPRLIAAAVLAARKVATEVWLESPDTDLAAHISRTITLLAAGLTDGS